MPEGLGAAPVAVAIVPLPEDPPLIEPVPEAEAEAPVPLGLTLPVEVGTSVAAQVVSLCPHCIFKPLFVRPPRCRAGVRTNLDTLVVADVCKSAQCLLCVVAAEALDLCGDVLGLANGLQVRRVGVLVDSAEEAARGCSDSELCESDEGSSEDGLGEHVGDLYEWFRLLKAVVRSVWS